jgi:hypothetical protein
MIEAAADWEPAFAEWLKPFLEALGHKVRLDLLQKSGGFLMRQRALHDAAETVYEGV